MSTLARRGTVLLTAYIAAAEAQQQGAASKEASPYWRLGEQPRGPCLAPMSEAGKPRFGQAGGGLGNDARGPARDAVLASCRVRSQIEERQLT